MKKNFFAILAMSVLFPAMAQELPQPSPAAKIEQRVGLTDITVEYSRPSVKGREIWGKLVPYDQMWRTGANANTKITFSTDVTIGGKSLKAGTYSFYAKPTKGDWTVYFNSKTDSWGTNGYDAKNDVLSFSVKPSACSHVESLRFTVDNITGKGADLVLAWEKVAISMKIEVDVAKQAMLNIEEALQDEKWKVYRNAANYMAENKIDLPKAKEYITKSIQLQESWYSYWVEADVLAAMNDKKGAITSAEKAIELGEKSYSEKGGTFTYREELENQIKEWRK